MTLFAQPAALLLLLVLPALWVLLRHARQQRRRALQRFGDPALLGRSSSLPPARPARGRAALWWGGLTLVIVALARPQLGRHPAPLARTGRDILVALDLSRSMKAADVGTTRLRLAKELAWRLAGARPGDRAGLVIFGGAGFLQLPPTSDLATFQLFLDAASPDDIADPSTNIGAGLRVAERALRHEGAALGSQAILVLTDGERSAGALDPILDFFGHAHLPVYAIGIGTTAGARVPADSGDPAGPWHLDDIGRPVISRLDEDVLRKIAAASGGAYARWDDAPALATVTRDLAGLEARTLASQPETEPDERYQWPLALGLLLLLAELLLRDRAAAGRRDVPSSEPRAALHRRAGVAAAGLVLVLGGTWSCRAQRLSLRGEQLYRDGKYPEAFNAWQEILRQQGGQGLRYNSGNALYRMRQYQDAAKTWRQALSGSPDQLREHAYFNMGNAYVRAAEDANALSGYLGRAVDAYEEALRLDPSDQEAKWNLEIALRRRGDTEGPGSRGRGGRANYGRGNMREEGYKANRETAVGAMAGGGQGGDEGETVRELSEQEARALLDALQRQQLSTHQGHRPKTSPVEGRDW